MALVRPVFRLGSAVAAFSAVLTLSGQPAAQAVGGTRQALDTAVLLRRARSVFVNIRRPSSLPLMGSPIGGLAIGRGRVLTTFSAIDETEPPQVAFAAGSTVAVAGVAAWNRRQDWAVLATAGSGPSPLPEASAPLEPGERCVSLARGPGGTLVLAEGTMVPPAATAGDRSSQVPGPQSPPLVARFPNARPLLGAPVLNATGESLGTIGTWRMEAPGTVTSRPPDPATTWPITPIPELAPPEASEPEPIEELWRRGVLLRPVAAGHALSGGFARQLGHAPTAGTIDQADAFVLGDAGAIHVFVTWTPKTRLRGDLVLRLSDDENRRIVESRPSATDLRPGQLTFTSWPLPRPTRAGVYHADVAIGETVYWRGFFYVVDTAPSPFGAGTLSGGAPGLLPGGLWAIQAMPVGAGIRPPRKITDASPAYPPDARRGGVQGRVWLEALIAETGDVTDVRVTRSIPLLDQAALDAVRRWKYEPSLVNGVAVPVVMAVTVTFALR